MSFFDGIKHKLKKAFIMGSVATTTLTGSAEAKESQVEETPPTPITQTQEVQDTTRVIKPATGEHKILLDADNQAEWDTMNTMLKDFSKTERGKDLLSNISPDLKITSNEKHIPPGALASYSYGQNEINIPSDALKNYSKNKNNILTSLAHESLHNIQDISKRSNSHKGTDGISGYGDFNISKLEEVETNLADAMHYKQFGANDSKPFADFYDSLKEKARQDPNLKGNEQAIERAAKTAYVKALWESTQSETKGPKEFKDWAIGYNAQATAHTLLSPSAQNDPQKTRAKIQKSIDAMGVDLTPDYFMDNHHTQKLEPQLKQLLNAKAGLDNKEYNQLKTSAGRLAYRHWLKQASDPSIYSGITVNNETENPQKNLTKLLDETKAIEEVTLSDNPSLASPLTPELEKKEDAFFKKGISYTYSSSDTETLLADKIYGTMDSSFSKFQGSESNKSLAKSNEGLKGILTSASHPTSTPQNTSFQKTGIIPHGINNSSTPSVKPTSTTNIPPAILQKSGGR